MVEIHSVLILFVSVVGLHFSGAAPGDEIWNFTEVRPGCQSFWWLMYSRASGDPSTIPLVLWISGGPGASGTGWGNFEELGPLDWNYLPRNYSWLDHAHLLFVDSPVGTGFSTVESPDLLVTNAFDNAVDLIATLKGVLVQAPDLVNAPLFILGESAAGRLGPVFAQELGKAITAGEIITNLQGVIIRGGFVDSAIQVPTYASYALETGLIDFDDFNKMEEITSRLLAAYDNEDYPLVDDLYTETLDHLFVRSYGANFYYILATEPPFFLNTTSAHSRFHREYYQDPLDFMEFQTFINTVVKPKLETRTPNLREWLFFNYDVKDAFAITGDSMVSTIPVIENLLQNTNLKVIVTNGQLDQIITNAGTLKWVQGLNWSGSDAWKAATRYPLVVNNVVEGYVKEAGKLSLWWINRAGHESFYHNPIAGYQLIQEIKAGLKKNVEL